MHGSPKSYTIGFVLSLILTFEAYYLVVSRTFAASTLVYIVLALAIVQLLIQLFFFLHFDQSKKSSLNITTFLFMGMVVAILVFGSLWIMKNLDYHMRSPAETEKYLERNQGL